MAAGASVVRAQVADCQVFECPACSVNHSTRRSNSALLWFVFCERCGGHYECERCGDTFILKPDGWYWLHANDALEKVRA